VNGYDSPSLRTEIGIAVTDSPRTHLNLRTPIALIALAMSLGLMATLTYLDQPLKRCMSPEGMISYEKAWYPKTADDIIKDWQSAGLIPRAELQIYIDLPFLIAYPISIGLTCWFLAELLRDQGYRRPAFVGRLLAWGQAVAGVCDAIEDAFLFYMLRNPSATTAMPISTTFTKIKFLLIILGLLYLFVAVALLNVRNRTPAAER